MNQRVQDHAYIRARKNVKGMEIELMKKKEKKMGLLTGVK
jgi:predicted hydrolase (HD superfamily)